MWSTGRYAARHAASGFAAKAGWELVYCLWTNIGKNYSSKEEKRIVETAIRTNGIQYLSALNDTTLIRVQFTPEGKRMYHRMLHLRPAYTANPKPLVYEFCCTLYQAETYFFKYGSASKSWSPRSSRYISPKVPVRCQPVHRESSWRKLKLLSRICAMPSRHPDWFSPKATGAIWKLRKSWPSPSSILICEVPADPVLQDEPGDQKPLWNFR